MEGDFFPISIPVGVSEYTVAQRNLQAKYPSFTIKDPILFLQFSGSTISKNTLFTLPHYPTEPTYMFAHNKNLRKLYFLGILIPNLYNTPLRFRPSDLSFSSCLESTEDTIISTPSMPWCDDSPSPFPLAKKPKFSYERDLPFPCITTMGGFPDEDIEGTEFVETIQEVWLHILYPTKYPDMISSYKPWMLVILFICKQSIFSKAYLAYHNNVLPPHSQENFKFVESTIQKNNILETVPVEKRKFFNFISEHWNY